MTDVEFEEEMSSSNLSFAPKKEKGVIGLLVRLGIAKNAQVAFWILVAFIVVCFCGSVYLGWKSVAPERTIPFRDLPKNIQQKFPISVQKFYKNQH